MDEALEMVETGRKGDVIHYDIVPQGVVQGSKAASIVNDYGLDVSAGFRDIGVGNHIQEKSIEVNGVLYHYVPWGDDDQLPYRVTDVMDDGMITAQCLDFNVTCCYGQGIRFVDRTTKEDVDDEEILNFCLHNSLHEVFLQQATSMKNWYWTVTVLTLDRQGKKIVMVENRDVADCRLEYAKMTKSGRIEHVFYTNWRIGEFDQEAVEVLPLLSLRDPLGDLEVRMGRQRDPMTGMKRKPTRDRRFAVVTRKPVPCMQYYPRPHHFSVLTDAWLDIYRLIGTGKRHMIKNTSAPRVQIEVHKDYWDIVCNNENILDPDKRVERKKKEQQDIIDFVTGIENAGKALLSSYFVDPNGKEQRMVRINTLTDGSKKEGGNWSDDMAEAANVICFAFGVHPNLVGATPGKSQMNNSGSDKRELFTLKQSLEKPMHDIMAKPYHLILHYNRWHKKCTVDVPMIQLTTLDEHKDSKKVSGNGNSESQQAGEE